MIREEDRIETFTVTGQSLELPSDVAATLNNQALLAKTKTIPDDLKQMLNEFNQQKMESELRNLVGTKFFRSLRFDNTNDRLEEPIHSLQSTDEYGYQLGKLIEMLRTETADELSGLFAD